MDGKNCRKIRSVKDTLKLKASGTCLETAGIRPFFHTWMRGDSFEERHIVHYSLDGVACTIASIWALCEETRGISQNKEPNEWIVV